MIRFVLTAVSLLFLWWAATSIPLGSRTLWGHLSAVWSTPEAKDMRQGIEEAAAPAVEKVKRGTAAGLEAAGAPAPGDAPVPAPPTPAIAKAAAPQLLAKAKRAAAAGKHGEAAALAEGAFAADALLAEAAMLAVTSNCLAKNTEGAMRMAAELGATARAAAATACRAQGIELNAR